MGHKIIARINKGQVQFEVQGVKGAACTDIAKRFSEALGVATNTQNTAEYYEAAEATESANLNQ